MAIKETNLKVVILVSVSELPNKSAMRNKKMNKEQFLHYFQHIPVSINNLYGDPFFSLQRNNTFAKLNSLESTNHKGIVSIITKSELTESDILEIKSKNLKTIILVSVSGLPNKKIQGTAYELTTGNRYNTLALCCKHSLPALAYVRPFVPPFNTSRETIHRMLAKIATTGIKNVIVSGLRGDDEILAKSGLTKSEYDKWSWRVKKIPKDIRAIIDQESTSMGLRLFERTSCGVCYVLSENHSYNPYYSAPQLCKCDQCPLKSTCFAKRDSFIPTDTDLELCEALGYDAEKLVVPHGEMCKTEPSKRTECMSCCTSCFMLNRSGIRIKGEDLKLGDVGLLRLLTHKLVYAKDVYDTGRIDIGNPQVNPNWYILNSWWSFSREISQCYGCSYCVVKHYNNEPAEYGGNPVLEAEKYWDERYSETYLPCTV